MSLCLLYYQVRIGIPHRQFPGLEDLFYKHGVDVQIYAHEHNYERLWPVYNKTVRYYSRTLGDFSRIQRFHQWLVNWSCKLYCV